MIHYQTIRRRLDSDWQLWFRQHWHLDRTQINRVFLKELNTAQRNYIHSVYSWSVDRDRDGYTVLLTVTTAKQATLAQLMF